MYLDQLADAIRAAVPDGTEIPDNAEKLFRLYAILARAKGAEVTAHDVHDAWSAWMFEVDPQHDALVPFDRLDAETQRADAPFVTAIKQVATEN